MARLLAIVLVCGAVCASASRHQPSRYRVQATAFCLHGITAAGTVSRTGTVAADPGFLPIGTTIRVFDAGAYSGEYVVTDTGQKIIGRHIDLRLPSPAAAKRFGKRTVWIHVVKWGDGQVGSVGT